MDRLSFTNFTVAGAIDFEQNAFTILACIAYRTFYIRGEMLKCVGSNKRINADRGFSGLCLFFLSFHVYLLCLAR
jgi:hypothetical protein